MNRNKRQIIVAIAVALAMPGSMLADSVRLANGTIPVGQTSVHRDGNDMRVRFTLNLDNLRLKGEQQLVLTPVLAGRHDSVALAPIYINGRAQEIRMQRGSYTIPEGAVSVRRHNGTAQTIDYDVTVPYKTWMNRAALDVTEDLCGCGKPENNDTISLRPYRKLVKLSALPVNTHEETGQAYVSFPINRDVILPRFRNNEQELSKILHTIDLVKQDSNVSITGVTIHGYSSPDGSYAHNADLANRRSKALAEYVSKLYSFDPSVCHFTSTPEDWDGFLKQLNDGMLDNKTKFALDIATNSKLTPDEKEARLHNGDRATVRKIWNDLFPLLRRSDYTVTYTVSPFSAEEVANLNNAIARLNAIIAAEDADGTEPSDETLNSIADMLSKAGNSKEADAARETLKVLQGE